MFICTWAGRSSQYWRDWINFLRKIPNQGSSRHFNHRTVDLHPIFPSQIMNLKSVQCCCNLSETIFPISQVNSIWPDLCTAQLKVFFIYKTRFRIQCWSYPLCVWLWCKCFIWHWYVAHTNYWTCFRHILIVAAASNKKVKKKIGTNFHSVQQIITQEIRHTSLVFLCKITLLHYHPVDY